MLFGVDSKEVDHRGGVDPDIFVDNDPATEWAGDDQQLDKAIAVLKKKSSRLKERRTSRPLPPYPKQ